MANSKIHLNPLIPTRLCQKSRRLTRQRSFRFVLFLGLFGLVAGLSQGFSEEFSKGASREGHQGDSQKSTKAPTPSMEMTWTTNSCESLREAKLEECVKRVSFYPQNDTCFQEAHSQYKRCNGSQGVK